MSLGKIHENGHTYFRLYICCPVCLDRGKRDVPIRYWTHYDNNCHGDIYIGDDANFKCTKCGHVSHVENWKYSCPDHSGSSDDFVGASAAALAEAVATAGQLVQEAGLDWLQKVLASLQRRGACGTR